ncbi:uncharacterized protein LOC144511365 [Mustelus asterias]
MDLVSTCGGNGSNEETVSLVDTGVDKEVSAVEAHPVGSSVECEPVGAADPPWQNRLASLIDASEAELCAVCASVDGRIEAGRSAVASREAITTNEEMRSKEKAMSDILVDLSVEVVCVTGESKEQGAAEEAAVRVQEEGISEETRLVEILNKPGSADGATVGSTLVSLLEEDRLSNASLVHESKGESEISAAEASEEQSPTEASQLDVSQCGTEARMADDSGKGCSSDLKLMEDTKQDRPSKEEVAIMSASKDGLAAEEAVGEADSLKEANVVSLSTLDASAKDQVCKREATSAICASKVDVPTTVDVVVLETSKESAHIDPSLAGGSVAASMADAPKDSETTKCDAVDKSQGGRLGTEEPMRVCSEYDDGWGSKPADQLKAKDPFVNMPKSTFVLNEFKWKYSNEDIRSVALPYLWDNFDEQGWSVWYMEYKYPQELCLDFMSLNLITGLFQCLDGLRKHSFASVILFGTDGERSISGIWILRGQQLISELNEEWQVTCEPYSWKKLDVDTDECKAVVNEYFMMEGAFQHVGKPFNQGKIFK